MKLYKYRHFDDKNHTKDIFKNKYIYCPKLSELNDPFDCQFKLENNVTDEIWDEYLDKENYNRETKQKIFLRKNEIISRQWEAVNSIFDNFGILSLSEIPYNILMWSHYTKDHEGICIEFDIPETEHLIKIEYPPSLNYPVIYLADILNKDEKKREMLKAVTGAKSIYWEYEQERRLIFENGSQKNDFKDFNCEITAVYFGCKCEDKDIEEIVNLCKDFKNCKFYKYKKSDSAYKLEIDEKYFQRAGIILHI